MDNFFVITYFLKQILHFKAIVMSQIPVVPVSIGWDNLPPLYYLTKSGGAMSVVMYCIRTMSEMVKYKGRDV